MSGIDLQNWGSAGIFSMSLEDMSAKNGGSEVIKREKINPFKKKD